MAAGNTRTKELAHGAIGHVDKQIQVAGSSRGMSAKDTYRHLPLSGRCQRTSVLLAPSIHSKWRHQSRYLRNTKIASVQSKDSRTDQLNSHMCCLYVHTDKALDSDGEIEALEAHNQVPLGG